MSGTPRLRSKGIMIHWPKWLLDDALCVDSESRSGLPAEAWDADQLDPVLRELAVRTCRACPALNLCRGWYYALPRSARPSGVVAGSVHMNERRNQHSG